MALFKKGNKYIFKKKSKTAPVADKTSKGKMPAGLANYLANKKK